MPMSARRGEALSQLWQFPLLIVSVGLFCFAAYLFVHPSLKQSTDDKIAVATKYLKQERPDAALAQLNQVLSSEKLDADREGKLHLMLAQALDMGQRQLKISIPANYRRIVEQTRLAIGRGAKLSALDYRRLGESNEAIDQPAAALQAYRQAMALDPDHTLRLQRKVIELQLDQDDADGADDSLATYLKDQTLTDAERSWALNQRAMLLIDRNRIAEAKGLLDDALKLASDPVRQGEVNFRLGYCAYKLTDEPEAERYFRVARDQLQLRHPLDADACFYLGEIYRHRNDPQTANSFYETVLTSHIDSKIMPLAKLGRGLSRLQLNQDDAALTDFHDLTAEVSEKPARAKLKEAAIEGLKEAGVMLANRQNLQGAIETMANEQTLDPSPGAGFFERMGSVFEKRAKQLQTTLATLSPADQIKRSQQIREMQTRAGDAFITYSQKLTLIDDKGYGDALWHGISLYDQAAALPYAISALELFITERPEDRLTPDATLRLGQAYQAQGQFDKAIETYQKNQLLHPQSLAASKSLVPMAQAYIAKGPEFYPKAERVLRGMLENNPLIDPQADEFRSALFDLAQLYYRTNRFEEAVARLQEFTQRYPDDDRGGQALYLMADSYRKSAGLLETKAAPAAANSNAVSDLAEITAAKRDRLSKAKDLYDRVCERYATAVPSTDVEKLYLKFAHFYRAECVYDLGNYQEAITLSDQAAFRYQDDPTALSAYVQIVNAYCALGKIDQARAANERGKLLLNRMPAEAFTNGAFAMPKSYWEKQFAWTNDSGLFSANLPANATTNANTGSK